MYQLAKDLKIQGVPCFPYWVRWNPKKTKWDKGPLVPKKESWLLTAWRPVDDPTLDWSSGVIGVPIPDNVVVIDLDTYKGATRAKAETILGCRLDWDAAFIQKTLSGGEHYAFFCSWPARLSSDIGGIIGFDIKVPRKSTICAGKGYTPMNHGGIFSFASPERLPVLPDHTQRILGAPTSPAPTTNSLPPPTFSTSDDQIIEALQHIDPSCSRTAWRNIGYALKALYRNDDQKGQELFESFSCGDFWDGEAPDNYVAEGQGSVQDQWPSFKAQGGVNPQTLFYWAIQGGWKPPPRFNIASAFSGQEAPLTVFNDLIDLIRKDASDIRRIPEVIKRITEAKCSSLQVALLAAELKTELKNSGLSTKDLNSHIDNLLHGRVERADIGMPGSYGKNDTDNAVVFLEKYYPDQTLCRCDGLFYRFTGKAWEVLPKDLVKHQVTTEMAAQRMQENKISSCFRLIAGLCPIRASETEGSSKSKVLFQNGILDLNTWHLNPHDKAIFTTNILPYAYRPSADCPRWIAFLEDIFDGDYERISLLQEWFGVLLSNETRYQKILMLLGARRCGKGTIGKVLARLVGSQNFNGGSLSQLAQASYIDSISEKPVVFMGDAEKKISPLIISQVVERLKSISGEDEISWHRMYHGNVSRVIPTIFTIAGNSVPVLFDDSDALASRIMVLTFDKNYYGREDHTLITKLLPEIEGIASWALSGLVRIRNNGHFTSPSASQQERDFLSDTYSPIKRFVIECCELDKESKVCRLDVYNAYTAWALAEGEDPVRSKVLISGIRDAFRGNGVTYGSQWLGGVTARAFKGLRLKEKK